LVDLSWFLYRVGNYALRAVYDAESVQDQLGSPLLEVGELKMKMVKGRLLSTAFVPLIGFELELLSNPVCGHVVHRRVVEVRFLSGWRGKKGDVR
jgi:hypothetical protein